MDRKVTLLIRDGEQEDVARWLDGLLSRRVPVKRALSAVLNARSTEDGQLGWDVT